MKKIAFFLVIVSMLFACAAQNRYETNLTVEAEVAALAEQYGIWRQMVDVETGAEWDQIFIPPFEQLDYLLDSYHNLLVAGLETQTIITEINRLKTQIMIALTKKLAQADIKETK